MLLEHNRPTLSACLITKNESRFLADCLASIQPIARSLSQPALSMAEGSKCEIIICDTGSTDNTLAIAHQFTDKVYQIPWEEDFAKARNESLRYATGDWILIIDADERLTSETQHTLIPFLQSIKTQGPLKNTPFVLNFKVLSGSQTTYKRAVFPNGYGIHFRRPIHEALYLPDQDLLKLDCPHLTLLHATRSPDEITAKTLRYRERILRELANPTSADDQIHYYKHLGHAYETLNQPIEALSAYQAAYLAFLQTNLSRQDGFFQDLLYKLVTGHLLHQPDLDAALIYAQEWVELFPDHAIAWFYLGYVYQTQDQWPKAQDAYEQAQQYWGQQTTYSGFSEDLAAKLAIGLGRCALMQNRFDKGLRWLEKAYKQWPQSTELQWHLCRGYLLAKQTAKAVQCYQRIYPQGGPLKTSEIKALERLAPHEPFYQACLHQLWLFLIEVDLWTRQEALQLSANPPPNH